MSWIKWFWIISLLLLETGHAQASAKGYKKRIEQAISAFEATPREHWAFKVSRFEDEEGEVTTSIERFVPHSEAKKRWQLIQLNDNPPTPSEVAEFLKKRAPNEEESFSIKLRDLIKLDTLTLVSETSAHLVMEFAVSIERLGDDAKNKLQGSLTYNKSQEFIESIQVVNRSDFSPMFLVTVTDFQLTMQFQQIEQAILPLENRMRLKGKMSVFTEIDEISTDTYTEYRYQGPVAPES